MPILKAILSKLDEVEEAFRGLYVQKGEKFEIQVDGLKTQGDVDRVSASLLKEREEHRLTKVTSKEATDKLALFGEVTPEQVIANAERLETLVAAGSPELTKNFEKIVSDRVDATLATRVKAETAKFTKQVTDLTTALGVAESKNGEFSTQITQRTIDDAVRGAATGAKLINEAVPDAMIIARGAFKIVDGKVQTEDGQTPDQWIEARKELSKHWWPVARGAGALGSDGQPIELKDNPFTSANWNVTAQSRLFTANAAKASQMAEQAGTKIGGARPPAPVK